MESGNSDAFELLRAMRAFLKENDMMAYLAMMAVRLLELHRVLKPTGSLYLHCDPTASHYLKLLLDAVFGKEQFLNEISWKRTFAHGSAKRFGPVHDTIFFYSKNGEHTWRDLKIGHDDAYIRKHFRMVDEKRGERFQAISLTGAGTRRGESGMAWRSIDPTAVGRHWALPRDVLQKERILDGSTQEKLDALDAAGRIHWPSVADGTPRLKWFVSDLDGARLGDVWSDIPPISAQARERLGYPTQKPLALLERIIAASSNEGDVVLDPFCGCGTTVHAAQKLGRRWIGIDITHLAISLIQRRLTDAFPQAQFNVRGVPKDLGGAKALAAADKHQFQLWALSLVEAQPFKGGKKGGDGGVDGYIYFRSDKNTVEKVVVSVKGGETLTPAMIKDLVVTVDNEKAKIGIFITLYPHTKGMVAEAAKAGFYDSPHHGKIAKIQIVTIEQLLDGKQPHIPFVDPSVFKKAKRERTSEQHSLDL